MSIDEALPSAEEVADPRDVEDARGTLLAELREHALVIGEVTLSSGATASYYVDARRALLRPQAFRAAGRLLLAEAQQLGAEAVGGPTMGAIPLACSVLASEGAETLRGFFVRGERKQHGLQRWVEGAAEPGRRCLVVEDTVTSGGSVVKAIDRLLDEGYEIAGTVCVVDRLAGGGAAIEAASGAPFRCLFTIDDVYPERPDR
jgi:orotate phosphoribosyltransferase